MKLEYLATGTGRCGTLNLAHNLTRAGIPCGHESVFDLKGIDGAKKRLNGEFKISASSISTDLKNESLWFDPLLIKADSSYMSAPYLENEILENTKIIHLMRDPLKVISSFVKNLGYFKTLDNPWEKFICSHVPSILSYKTPLERACEYYLKWNKMISEHNVITHKIENNFNELLEKINQTHLNEFSNEKNLFKSRDSDFEINDIPKNFKDEIINFMEYYSYL